MVGFFGVMKVLYELGILDCVIYVVGFFGFIWYMLILYFYFDFLEKGLEEINEELMKNVSYNFFLFFILQKVKRYVEFLWKKKSFG